MENIFIKNSSIEGTFNQVKKHINDLRNKTTKKIKLHLFFEQQQDCDIEKDLLTPLINFIDKLPEKIWVNRFKIDIWYKIRDKDINEKYSFLKLKENSLKEKINYYRFLENIWLIDPVQLDDFEQYKEKLRSIIEKGTLNQIIEKIHNAHQGVNDSYVYSTMNFELIDLKQILARDLRYYLKSNEEKIRKKLNDKLSDLKEVQGTTEKSFSLDSILGPLEISCSETFKNKIEKFKEFCSIRVKHQYTNICKKTIKDLKNKLKEVKSTPFINDINIKDIYDKKTKEIEEFQKKNITHTATLHKLQYDEKEEKEVINSIYKKIDNIQNIIKNTLSPEGACFRWIIWAALIMVSSLFIDNLTSSGGFIFGLTFLFCIIIIPAFGWKTFHKYGIINDLLEQIKEKIGDYYDIKKKHSLIILKNLLIEFWNSRIKDATPSSDLLTHIYDKIKENYSDFQEESSSKLGAPQFKCDPIENLLERIDNFSRYSTENFYDWIKNQIDLWIKEDLKPLVFEIRENKEKSSLEQMELPIRFKESELVFNKVEENLKKFTYSLNESNIIQEKEEEGTIPDKVIIGKYITNLDEEMLIQ